MQYSTDKVHWSLPENLATSGLSISLGAILNHKNGNPYLVTIERISVHISFFLPNELGIFHETMQRSRIILPIRMSISENDNPVAESFRTETHSSRVIDFSNL
jgi:hypothetical protein